MMHPGVARHGFGYGDHMRVHIGTSGWVYRDWRGPVYPADLPQRRWLGWFSERFPTVEVNNSFYRLPAAETFDRWRQETAEGFVFGVKAVRYVTHVRRLRDCGEPVATFWERAERLGEKLGPVLFQMPPGFKADVPLLAAFLRVLPSAMRPAFEFRDASWDTGEVRDLLDGAGAAWVLADRPGWRVPAHVTAGWSYVRFHEGNPTGPDYPRPKLQRWARRIASLPAHEAFVYFNNDPTGAAVRDARTLTSLLGTADTPLVSQRQGA
jgi:uncharacterized protein YecE (DUF72 family)